MKKITLLTILFTGFIASSYAQLQKTSLSPAYDNIQNERLLKHMGTPREMDKYALMENNTTCQRNYTLTYGNPLTLGNYKQKNGTLYKMPPPAAYPGKYDIKKVTFPKNNYLLN